MIENITNLIVAAAAVIGAITATLLAGLAIWTFRDIRSRSRDVLVQILATVMVAVIPVAGILVYLMLRPRETLAEAYIRALEEESLLASIEHQEFCPGCGRRVDHDMRFCPSCHSKLRNACPHCGRAVHLSWDVCPYCGGGLTPELPVVKKPAARQIFSPTPTPAKAIPETETHSVKRIAQPVAGRQTLRAPVEAEPIETASPRLSARASPTVTVGSLLDKVGEAIERVVDRLSAGKSAPQDGAAEAVEAPPHAPARQAVERLSGELRPAHPPASPSNRSVPSPAPSGRGGTQPNKPADPAANGQTGSTKPIKPLISRDELLE